MRIVFLSNYFNHHQEALSEELFFLTNGNYYFIETAHMEEERIKLGWELKKTPSYVIKSYESIESYKLIKNLVDSADVVIIGSAPEKYIKNRLKKEKLIFRFSERPLKKGLEIYKYPYRYIKWHIQNPKKAKIYMLCASAYTAGDYAKFGLFKNKCFKWGYFPEVKYYEDINNLINTKKKNSIIWVGRFIDWKHPEIPCLIGERLLKEGYQFEINMIGTGDLFENIRKRIEEKGLTNHIHLLGPMNPKDVRKYMEKSEIHIFTSDKQEGWGVVLNESMNSACVPIASHAIGSVPFLINNSVNGYIYKDGDIDDLYAKIKFLLDNRNKIKEIGEKAYKTITELWSPKIAAKRFIKLTESLLNGENNIELFENGPCSKADIISDDWFININININ